MLRIRPTLRTGHAAGWSELFLALGLREMTQLPATAGSTSNTNRCFAADAGRILVQDASDAGTELHFEVRDLEIFARWTISDGTPVTLIPAAPGSAGPTVAHITAPDSVKFTALAVDPLDTDGTPPELTGSAENPRGNLTVLIRWHTPDPSGIIKTLQNIGAKSYAHSPDASSVQYRAKHGGRIEVCPGESSRIELSLEYAGDLETLVERVSKTPIGYRIDEDNASRVLLVQHPDHGYLRIVESNADVGEQTRP